MTPKRRDVAFARQSIQFFHGLSLTGDQYTPKAREFDRQLLKSLIDKLQVPAAELCRMQKLRLVDVDAEDTPARGGLYEWPMVGYAEITLEPDQLHALR